MDKLDMIKEAKLYCRDMKRFLAYMFLSFAIVIIIGVNLVFAVKMSAVLVLIFAVAIFGINIFMRKAYFRILRDAGHDISNKLVCEKEENIVSCILDSEYERLNGHGSKSFVSAGSRYLLLSRGGTSYRIRKEPDVHFDEISGTKVNITYLETSKIVVGLEIFPCETESTASEELKNSAVSFRIQLKFLDGKLELPTIKAVTKDNKTCDVTADVFYSSTAGYKSSRDIDSKFMKALTEKIREFAYTVDAHEFENSGKVRNLIGELVPKFYQEITPIKIETIFIVRT